MWVINHRVTKYHPVIITIKNEFGTQKILWQGEIRFSMVNVPVRLHAAVDKERKAHFDWLTKGRSHQQVGYVKTDKETA